MPTSRTRQARTKAAPVTATAPAVVEPQNPQCVAEFRFAPSVAHSVYLFDERDFDSQDFQPGEERSEEDPFSEALSLNVRIEDQDRGLEIKRSCRVRPGILKELESCNLYLDSRSWPRFVAMVNAADAEIKKLLERNPQHG